jgi:hypothetical protein
MTAKSSSKEPLNFLGYIQLHERLWGMDTYPERPTLEAMLSAPVAALWYPAQNDDDKAKKDIFKQERFTITIHQDLRDIENHINRLIFRLSVQTPRHRLARVFVKGKEVRVKNVAITFEEVAR